ncbi:hypothetical protein HPP92_003179 [Vanilla planifolia]|uniref:CRAL-TRIO domain-containing protein n=1 Tax=Vanilla planifolia TaxID=51239 RepID=A0A835VIN1_VANPL|nr:hypothetical protein HPP92_003179 [Vanilla planifolia]
MRYGRCPYYVVSRARGGAVCVGEMEPSEEGEWKKVSQMRSIVEAKDAGAKEVDDFMLRRFLRARDLNLERASEMFLRFLKWRRTAVPLGFISEKKIENELSQKKVLMLGFSKKGNPMAVGFASKHYPSKRDMEEFRSLVVYYLDKLCASMPGDQEKFIVIGDLKGWGYSNCDIRGYLACLEIVQSYYPERLEKAYLIHVPYLFMKAWRIIFPFIDKRTRSKYIFVDDKDIRSTLLQEIDENQLPEMYGGKLKLDLTDAAN